MANPFLENGMSAPAAAKINEAIYEAKQEAQGEIQSIFGGNAANEIMAKISWRDKIFVFAGQVGNLALDFIKRAVQLAIAKFVLELCAMTIDSIMRALTKTGAHKMDITSPNVVYAAQGTVPPASTSGGLFNRFGNTQSSSGMTNRAQDFHGASTLGW